MAGKFQVIKLTPRSGVKEGRAWELLAVGGVYTGDDGVVEMGEVMFMKRDDRPIPELAVGQSYLPVISASARDGKLQFQITELKPLPAASSRASAA